MVKRLLVVQHSESSSSILKSVHWQTGEPMQVNQDWCDNYDSN